MAIGGAVWGYLLGRVTGYRQPWRLLLGGFLGVSLGASLGTMGVFGLVNALLPGAPVHVRFGLAFPLIIDATALAAGLALGIAAFRGRALPHLGMAAGLSPAAPSAIVVLALELLGVRVGGGNAAMAKVAALGFLVATLASGAVIGVVFARRVVRQE